MPGLAGVKNVFSLNVFFSNSLTACTSLCSYFIPRFTACLMFYINPLTFQTFHYTIKFHCNVNDISRCSMTYIVHSSFSSVTTKFDKKTPPELFPPWMEFSPIPNILPEILDQDQTEHCPHPYPEKHLQPSPGSDNLKDLTFTQGFSRVGGCPTQSSSFHNQPLQ